MQKTFIIKNIINKIEIKIIYNKEKIFMKKKWTPLHMAAFMNSKEIGQILISLGAKINEKTTNSFILLLMKKIQFE